MIEPYACERCGETYDEASGDGYCGLCPDCADKTEHRYNPAPFCAKCGGPCEMSE